MSISRLQRAPSPTSSAYSGLSRFQSQSQSQSRRPMPSSSTSDSVDTRKVAKLHFDEIQVYLNGDPLKETQGTRASAREKLTRLTKQQFTELSTDVYDELLRRKSNKLGNEVPFLPFRQDFHPKRNQARQKLATLPSSRFKDLAGDVYFELNRRYPEFKEPEFADSVPPAGSSQNEDIPNFDSRDRTHTSNQSLTFSPSSSIRRLAPDRRGLPDDPRSSLANSGRPSRDDSVSLQSALGNVATATSGLVIPNKSTITEEEIRVPYADDDGAIDDKYDDQDQSVEDLDNHDSRAVLKTPSSPSAAIKGLNALTGLGNRSHRDSDDEVPRKSDSDYAEGNRSLPHNSISRGTRTPHQVDEDQLRSDYDSIILGLQARVKMLEEELAQAHSLHSESQERARQLIDDIEQLHSNAQNQNMTIMSLQQELGDARSFQGQHNENLRNDYELEIRTLQERCEKLERERETFQRPDNHSQILEQLRSDLETVLTEANELSNRNEELLAARDKDNSIIRDLNSQMKEYKRKYEQAKTELRSLKATSQLYHQLPKQSVEDQLPVTQVGGLLDIHVTAFLSSIDLLLAAGRSPTPSRVYSPMKAVINAVHAILEDVENYQARARRERLNIDTEELNALRERAEMTLSNLTAAARTHATSLGMSPVSLLDAAASHVSTTVTEIGKAIQIRKATKSELDLFASTPASPKPMSPTGYPPFRSTNDDTPHDAISRASSRAADEPMSSPPRRVREMSPPRNNFIRSLGSPLVHPAPVPPPPPVPLHAPMPVSLASPPIMRQTLENPTSPSPMNADMSFGSNGTMTSDDSTTSENAEDAWAELKPYLEAQSESIKYAIQSVLSSVRSPVISPNLNENLTQIITIVSSIVAVCKDSLPASSLKEGNDILTELSEYCNRLSEIQAMPEITKESRQAMAKSSFAIATAMKSLVKM